MFYEYNLLNHARVRQTMGWLEGCEWENSKSGPQHKNIKNCYTPEKIHQKVDISVIQQMIFGAINDSTIRDDLVINDCSPPVILKYETGNYYDNHLDSYQMNKVRTDYSATLFLNDDYEGGELAIDLGSEVIKKRGKPGELFVYPTSFRHMVLPITSGNRYVCVFWLQSSIQEDTVRTAVQDLTKYLKLYQNNMEYEQILYIEKARTGLIRKYGRFD